jgi:DNA primase
MEKYEILKKEHTSLSYEKESLTGYSTNPRKSAAKSGKITEAMIEAARNFPIETLFEEAVRGNMVCCPFHEDKSPSASIRHNRLHCFAGCSPKGGQSSWSPISLLMERDGLNFPAAVRRLAA